jgi:hypothetical protein
MDMTLWSAHSGQPLIQPVQFKHSEVRELDDFERGWKLTGSIFIPSGLKQENWQKVYGVVMPFTLQWAKKELLVFMHQEIRNYATDPEQDFAERMAKRMALVVGVNRHDDYLIHNLRYADADARAFYEFLTDPYRGGVPIKNIRVFENHTATLENVKEAFKFIREYCREDDTVFVYFAGYGAVMPDEETGGDGYRKYLLMADTKIDEMSQTALSVDDLDAECDLLKARNVVIFMDTSFSQGGETRTYVDVRQPPQEIVLSDDYLKKLSDTPGRIVLAACGVDQGALMLDEEQQGLFTHYFLEGTQIPSDDNVLTLQEILDYAIPAAEDRADIEGLPQLPTVFGEGAAGIELVLLAGEGPPPEEEGGTPPVEEMPEEDIPGGGQ